MVGCSNLSVEIPYYICYKSFFNCVFKYMYEKYLELWL